MMQWVLLKLHLLRLEKRKITILNHVSSILIPGRTTLLLGPPGGGKVCFCSSTSHAVTLLKAVHTKQAMQCVWTCLTCDEAVV